MWYCYMEKKCVILVLGKSFRLKDKIYRQQEKKTCENKMYSLVKEHLLLVVDLNYIKSLNLLNMKF